MDEIISNQKQQILDYIDRFGSITTFEAFADLGITKLTTRISELRREDGIAIADTTVTGKNRLGKTIQYKRYRRG